MGFRGRKITPPKREHKKAGGKPREREAEPCPERKIPGYEPHVARAERRRQRRETDSWAKWVRRTTKGAKRKRKTRKGMVGWFPESVRKEME